MRMIVAGGGTGGHLFPGLAVAQAAKAQDAKTEILFVGSKYGIEATVLPRTEFAFAALAVRGLRGRGLRGIAEFLQQIPLALLRSVRLVRSFRPHLVLGLGGYGSVPVVVAAWLCGVPSVLLEQNAHPGMANRLLARLARRVCTTFSEGARFFPAGKSEQTGNPVRQLKSERQPEPGHFTIFVFGGSQGARSINRAAVGAVSALKGSLAGLSVLHQTGGADVEWVERQYRDMQFSAEVHAFVHDMGDAYGRADLIVCRAGATTLAEITALAKPAILVPYPFAADDHQRANAESLVKRNAAEMILDSELSGDVLAKKISELHADPARRARMAAAASSLATPDAAERVLSTCSQIAGETAQA